MNHECFDLLQQYGEMIAGKANAVMIRMGSIIAILGTWKARAITREA